jgi:hypothetical protein
LGFLGVVFFQGVRIVWGFPTNRFHCFWGFWVVVCVRKKCVWGFVLFCVLLLFFLFWGCFFFFFFLARIFCFFFFFFFFFFCIMVVDFGLVLCLFAVTVGWIYIVFSVIFCCLGGNWMKVWFADLGSFFFFFCGFWGESWCSTSPILFLGLSVVRVLWVIFGYSGCLLVGVFVLFLIWIGVGNGFFFSFVLFSPWFLVLRSLLGS